MGTLLLVALLAGCISGDPSGPDTRPGGIQGDGTQGAFEAAALAAFDASDDENLVAVFGVASPRPMDHETVSSNLYPGIAAATQKLLEHRSPVPGDGDLPAWAFIFEASRTADELTYVIVEPNERQGDPPGTTKGTLARGELILLRAERTIGELPALSPRQALEAALENEEWSAVTTRSGTFVMYVLAAAETGGPEWRMIASPYELSSDQGRLLAVDARSGNPNGSPQGWPDQPVRGLRLDEEGRVLPGHTETLEFTLENDTHPFIHLLPRRTSTGGILFGPPNIEVQQPDGENRDLTLDETTTIRAPEAGKWEVVFTWEQPDIYRSIRVEYCLPPVPYLLGERIDLCDE